MLPFSKNVAGCPALPWKIAVLTLVALIVVPGAAEYRADRILVFPKPGREAELARVHNRGSGRVLQSFGSAGGVQVVQIGKGETPQQAIARYRASGLVLFAEPDYKLRAHTRPNDPDFVNQWGLENTGQQGGSAGADIRAVTGWKTARDASTVVVAVIDSGIRDTHEDLRDNLWVNEGEIPGNGIDDDGNEVIDDVHGLDAVNDTGDPTDEYGHGTHVAGIIGARGDNGKGIAGVAWKVQLMACKFLDEFGNGDTSDAIQCIDYARRNGAKIINASWGGEKYSAALYTAIANARSAGIVLVTASGNRGVNLDEEPLYPASFDLDNILTVCGTDRNDQFDGSYSNYSPTRVHVAAPGTDILSSFNLFDEHYTWLSGTSMSAPYVTGIIALLKARHPQENERQLIERVLKSVDVLESLAGKCSTGGRVNLEKALATEVKVEMAATVTAGEAPLTVTFSNRSSGEVKSVEWDFGDGSGAKDVNTPTHRYMRPGRYTAKLRVNDAAGNSFVAETVIRALPNYQWREEEFSWVDPASHERVELNDLPSKGKELPFVFPFYGEDISEIYIGGDGLITINELTERNTEGEFPSTNGPNGMIAPLWRELDLSRGGVFAGVTGETPNRALVVTWEKAALNEGAVLSVQAVLHEGGEITMQYRVDEGEDIPWNAVAGLEDLSGRAGLAVNLGAIALHERAVRFARKPFISIEKVRTTNAGAEYEVFADLPGEYRVEGSTDLQDWTEVVRHSGATTFRFEHPFDPGKRFFRVRKID